MQEAISLPVMVLIAALMVAVGGLVVWHFQDAQRVADWAAAAVYPLAKPYNATHFWLGAQAAFADVEISRVAVDGAAYALGVKAPQGRQVWLNYSGGPLLVKCNSTVAYEVERGSASRVLQFKAVCPRARSMVAHTTGAAWQMLAAYADYVLDYVAFNNTAVIAAYFKAPDAGLPKTVSGPCEKGGCYTPLKFKPEPGVYIKNIWNRPVTVVIVPRGSGVPGNGSVYYNVQDAFSVVKVVTLMPGEEYKIASLNSTEPYVVLPGDQPFGKCVVLPDGGIIGEHDYAKLYVSRLWRWVYAHSGAYGGGAVFWMNTVPLYNSSAPASGVSPHGTPYSAYPNGAYALGAWTYLDPTWPWVKAVEKIYFPAPCECVEQGKNCPAIKPSAVASGDWAGLVEVKEVPNATYFKNANTLVYVTRPPRVPWGSLDIDYDLYVFPGTIAQISGPVLDASGNVVGRANKTLGVQQLAPVYVYELVAALNGSAVKLYWLEPGASPDAVRALTLAKPGYHLLNYSAIAKRPGKGAYLLYKDSDVWLAIKSYGYGFSDLYLAYGLPSQEAEYGNLYEYNDASTAMCYSKWQDRSMGTAAGGDKISGDSLVKYGPVKWTLICRKLKREVVTPWGGSPQLVVTPGEDLFNLTAVFDLRYFDNVLFVDMYKNGEKVASHVLQWKFVKYVGVVDDPFPKYIPLLLYWNGTDVKMWVLDYGPDYAAQSYYKDRLSFIYYADYVGLAKPHSTHTGLYARLPIAFKIVDFPHYRYRLTAKAGYTTKVLRNETSVANASDVYAVYSKLWYQVNSSGVLKLYLWDKLAAYDAYNGTGYIVVENTKLNLMSSTPPPGVEEECVPKEEVVKREGHFLTNYVPTQSGYQVDVTRVYQVRTTGCGIDRTECRTYKVTTALVNSNTLFVTDRTELSNIKYCNIKGVWPKSAGTQGGCGVTAVGCQ